MCSQRLSLSDNLTLRQLFMAVIRYSLLALLILNCSLCCCYELDTEAVNRYHKHDNSSLPKNEEHMYISHISKKQKSQIDYAKDELKNHSNFATNRVKSSHDSQSESNSSSPLNSIDLLIEAKVIAFRLQKVINEELLVPKMQEFFDASTFVDVNVDLESQLNEIVDKMESKLRSYESILDSIGNRVHELYIDYLHNGGFSTIKPCCSPFFQDFEYDNHFGTRISKSSSCSVTPFPLTKGAFNPGYNLTQEFYENLINNPSIKWQYFISAWGVFAEYPGYQSDAHCGANVNVLSSSFKSSGTKKSVNYEENEIGLSSEEMSIRHRDVYLSTVLSTPKYVVLVIDQGSALSIHQLSIAKAVAKQILNSLSHKDKVGLIALSNSVHFPSSDSCLTHQMAFANYETKYHFTRFIDSLPKISGSTNHILGLNRAFEIINNTLNTSSSNVQTPEALIVYISRGLLSSLTDAKIIMELISSQISNSNYQLVINSYALIDENKPVMYETTFLKDMADQNFKKYKVKTPEKSKIKPGIMIALNSTEHLSFIIKGVYSVLTKSLHTSTQFSLPYWDQFSKELDVSISKAVVHRGHLAGVVGVDVALADLAEDVINFDLSPHSYAFLVEKTTGTVLIHPSFGRPSQAQEPLMNTDMLHLEQYSGFHRIRSLIMRDKKGVESLIVNKHSSLLLKSKIFDGLITYYWKHIDGSPYILCVVSTSKKEEHQYINVAPQKESSFVYHRLDLLSTTHRCKHMKQLSSLDTSALFLSSLSFYSPYRFSLENETMQIVQRFLAYLNDNTKLIANPGLKAGVRGDTLVIARITEFWRKQSQISDLTKYIVRRYVATPNGPFLVYPATVLDQRFEPTRREWYTRAVAQPGHIIFTAPYLDSGGAGYVVTISYTVNHPRQNGIKTEVAAVMGIDFTLGYFHKLMLDSIPLCNENTIKCFIMDDRGYLIAHPSLVEPAGRGPVEYTHVTHKEPLVANDLLNHKHFVHKNICNSFGDRTIQRFYQFNTSFDSLLTNFVTGDHCAKYNIASLPETNVFIGIVNQICDSATAFCPCSMTDRLCLNCHRMEQTDCECPCECPLEINLCTAELFDNEDKNPSCLPYTEEVHEPTVDRFLIASVPKCYDIDCSFLETKSDCMGVIGCEWCQLSVDGITPLNEKFCSAHYKCFRGVLGARGPYADEITDAVLVETTRSTPVALVALAVGFCFLLFASTFYYYRHRIQGMPQYFSEIRENNLRMSHLDNDTDEIEYIQESSPNVAPNQILLAGFQNAAIISPYRLNPGYRRPPGGDSDHGYSTMTPHEDSEMAGPPFIEPLLISKDKLKIVPDANHSSSRDSSVCLQPQSQEMTVLAKVPAKGPHFLAQVQVHVVDVN